MASGIDTVYVSGLPDTVTEQDLAQLFGSIGQLKQDKKRRCVALLFRVGQTSASAGSGVPRNLTPTFEKSVSLLRLLARHLNPLCRLHGCRLVFLQRAVRYFGRSAHKKNECINHADAIRSGSTATRSRVSRRVTRRYLMRIHTPPRRPCSGSMARTFRGKRYRCPSQLRGTKMAVSRPRLHHLRQLLLLLTTPMPRSASC